MMYRNFYKDESEISKKFAAAVKACNKPVSAAQLQGFFMRHKEGNFDALVRDIELIWS